MEIFIVFFTAFFTQNWLLQSFVGLEGVLRRKNIGREAFREGLFTSVFFLFGVILFWLLGHFVLFPQNLTFVWSIIIPFYSVLAQNLVYFLLEKEKIEDKLLYNRRLLSTGYVMLALFIVFQEDRIFTHTLSFAFFGLLGYFSAWFVLKMSQKELERRKVFWAFRGAPMSFIIAGILSLLFSSFQNSVLGGL